MTCPHCGSHNTQVAVASVSLLDTLGRKVRRFFAALARAGSPVPPPQRPIQGPEDVLLEQDLKYGQRLYFCLQCKTYFASAEEPVNLEGAPRISVWVWVTALYSIACFMIWFFGIDYLLTVSYPGRTSQLLYALPISIPMTILMVIVGEHLQQQRRTDRRSRRMALLTLVVFLLFVNSAGVAGAELVVNGFMDSSPVTFHTVRVVATPKVYRERFGLSSSDRYEVIVVESWREEGKTERIWYLWQQHISQPTVWSADRKNIKPRSVLTVATKRGRLGMEWVVGLSQGRAQ